MKKINIFLNIVLISIYAMPVMYGMEDNLYNSFTGQELKHNSDNDITSFEDANNNFQKIDNQTWYNFLNLEELEPIYDILNSSNQTTNEIQYNEYQLPEGIILPTSKSNKHIVCQICNKEKGRLSTFTEEEIVNHLTTHISPDFCEFCSEQITNQLDHITTHLNELNNGSSNYLSWATAKQIRNHNGNIKRHTTINKKYVSCKICASIKGKKSLFTMKEIKKHIPLHVSSDKFCLLCKQTINDDKKHIKMHIKELDYNSSTSSLTWATAKQVSCRNYIKRKQQRKREEKELAISDQASNANNDQPNIPSFDNLKDFEINLETPAKKQHREKET